MADEIRSEVIKKTQSSLGKYIKKPPLTEKLLRKPPFRFLHDIVSAIIKETGFFEGLFSEEELNSDFKDKETKIAYLTKLINVTKLVTGVELTVRPVKIVCGQEPTKTNQLLQAIANALDKNVSSTEAVKHYKASVEKNVGRSPKNNSPKDEQLKTGDAKHSVHGKKVTEQREKEKATRVSQVAGTTRKQSDRLDKTVKNKDGLSTGKSQSTKKVKMVDEAPVPSKISSNLSLTVNKSTSQKDSVAEKKQRPGTGTDHIQPEVYVTSESNLPPEVERERVINQNEGDKDSTIDVSSKEPEYNKQPELIDKSPRTEKSVSSLHEDAEIRGNVADTTKLSVPEQPASLFTHSMRPPSGRPSSARPAAPKLRWKPEFSIKSNDLVLMENESVILDNFDAQDDDKDSMVVVETDTHEHSTPSEGQEIKNSDMTQEHGYLVAQILETQRELAKTSTVNHVSNKIDKELDGVSMKVKETAVQEVDKLRGKIQTLTRATNPMGNLLDFWQEDVELMQKELLEWQSQFRQLHNELKIEKTSSHTWAKQREESLSEIKAAINDQHDKTYNIKLNIIKNNHKIQQLLDGRA